MFSELISSFAYIIGDVIHTCLSNDLLSYMFYLGILGLVLSVIRYIIAFSNADIDISNSEDISSQYDKRSLPHIYVHPHNYKALPKSNYPKKR